METLPYPLTCYPLDCYQFGTVEGKKPATDPSNPLRVEKLEQQYEKQGMRRSVEALLVVHNHGHPHVLLLKSDHGVLRLPGGRLRPGESELEGLQRKLETKLGLRPPPHRPVAMDDDDEGEEGGEGDKEGQESAAPVPPPVNEPFDFEIGPVSGQWWRPHFTREQYPYPLPHITKHKECTKVFLIRLEKAAAFSVARTSKLVAVPVFELMSNPEQYSPIVAAIPVMLSRCNFMFLQ